MTALYAGIDPGKTGAVALVDEQGRCVGLHDCPTIKAGKKQEFDPAGMAELLAGRYLARIVLEKSQAMPAKLHGRRQGVSSTFQTGYGFGLWVGILAELRAPYDVTHPRTWQARMLRDVPSTDTKGRSLLRARQLWPDQIGRLGKTKHGRSDALLMAEFARLTAGRGSEAA